MLFTGVWCTEMLKDKGVKTQYLKVLAYKHGSRQYVEVIHCGWTIWQKFLPANIFWD